MKIIDKNPHLKTKEQRINRVARSQHYSHKIEGIDVSKEKLKLTLTQDYYDA